MPSKQYRPQRARPQVIEETLVSTSILDDSMRAILRQIRLDRDHDVPYLAGSSRDGRTVFIDRHLPKFLTSGHRRIPTDCFIILHEVIEKLLFDRFQLSYAEAHQIALRMEQVAVRNAKISWHDYNVLMQSNVKRAHDERLVTLPKDLEIKPYEDEGEVDLIRRKQRGLSLPEHVSTTMRRETRDGKRS